MQNDLDWKSRLLLFIFRQKIDAMYIYQISQPLKEHFTDARSFIRLSHRIKESHSQHRLGKKENCKSSSQFEQEVVRDSILQWKLERFLVAKRSRLN